MSIHKFWCTILFLFLNNISSFALINGKVVDGSGDLVRLIFNNKWVCTGTFINETTILTAAHCLVPENAGDKLELDQVLSIKDETLPIRQVALIKHPKYNNGSWPSRDIGIIKTTFNQSFRGDYKIEYDLKFKNIFGNAILFGCGKIDINSDIRARTTCESKYFQMGSVLFFVGHSIKTDSELGKNCSIAPNDSGGPILDSNTNRIIGISTNTTVKQSSKFGLPSLSSGASLLNQENIDFINENI